MGENSKIEWTDHTFNGWFGCQHVSPGCDNCYAETLMDKRYHKVEWGPHGIRMRTSPQNWQKPSQWAKKARQINAALEAENLPPIRPRVFSASLSDWLDNQVPQLWRTDLAFLIDATPELDWLLLTKRIENFRKLSPWPLSLPSGGQIPFPPNVWLGVTAEDQEHYDKRWPILQQIPATVRFISYEPAIGSLQLFGEPPYPDWFIFGGESGPNRRPCDLNWARAVQYGCKYHGLAFFMKQTGDHSPIPQDLLVREFPQPGALPCVTNSVMSKSGTTG